MENVREANDGGNFQPRRTFTDRLKNFFNRKLTKIRPDREPGLPQTRTCSDANCSSYNLGFPLKSCLRGCAIVGMVSSVLYVIAGTSLIAHMSQTEFFGFSSYEAPAATTRNIYYKRNVKFFTGMAMVLVVLNIVQIFSDMVLFLSTFKVKQHNVLWVNMMLDIALWIMTLICFITIFSGSGLFLLLVFLIGTAIRSYIIFILHEYMIEIGKAQEEEDAERTDVERIPSASVPTLTPIHEIQEDNSSTIPADELTKVEGLGQESEVRNIEPDVTRQEDNGDMQKPA